METDVDTRHSHPHKDESLVQKVERVEYNRLLRKYKDQQKILNKLKAEEKMELRDTFKSLGRKRKYTPLKMKNRIIDYLALMKAKGRPPTKSGLMVHLKMHRDQFYAYASYPEFKDIMEQTAQFMENWYEEALILNKYNGPGVQFALKNRFGWTDTQTIRHEDSGDEAALVRKIEALAPELVSFFRKVEEQKSIEDRTHSNGQQLRVVEAEFTDEDFAIRGNE